MVEMVVLAEEVETERVGLLATAVQVEPVVLEESKPEQEPAASVEMVGLVETLAWVEPLDRVEVLELEEVAWPVPLGLLVVHAKYLLH